jgi:hypothetical protein
VKVLAATVLVVAVVLLVVPGPRTSAAQSPVSTSVPVASFAPDEGSDDTGGRPWGRIAVFLPLSVAIGAAAVYGRRFVRDRGWTQS